MSTKIAGTWTKGPLSISEPVKLRDGLEVRYVEKGSTILAQCWSPPCDRSDRAEADNADQERDANAALYAAAPDLAEACAAQLSAIDSLFACLIALDPAFYATKSPQWAAFMLGQAALRKAGAL